MYTSYFGQIKKISNPVSISRFPPFWYKGPRYSLLAPSEQLLNLYKLGKISNPEYTIRFNDYLKTLDAAKVYETLTQSYGDCVLLCYEKSNEFCHRHLVSKWLEENLDISVTELKF